MNTLRHPRFAAFWAAGVVSSTGTWLQFVLSTIVVYAWTGSETVLGLLGAASFLPLLLFTLPAGVISDRWDRRRMVVVTHVVAMVGSLILALLIQQDVRAPEAVAVGAFVMYACYAFSKPALSALFPAMVPRSEIPQATALNSLSFLLGQLFGPLLAGLCVAVGSPALGFVLNGLSYVAVIAVVAIGSREPDGERKARASVASDLADAGRYLRADHRVAAMLVVVAVTVPVLDVIRTLAPALTAQRGAQDDGAAALVAASLGLGSALGLLLATRAYDAVGPGRVLPVGLVGMGLTALGVIVAGDIAMMLVATTALGMMYGLVFGTSTAVIQAMVPDRLRGRVMSVHTLVHLGTRPILLPIAGAIAAVAGVMAAIGSFILLLPLGVVAALVADRQSEPEAGADRAD
ncbi:MAG: MFS transporter [Chloroflexi bacterium]|nr:MFS transporter [Chloroflexota bacterium]